MSQEVLFGLYHKPSRGHDKYVGEKKNCANETFLNFLNFLNCIPNTIYDGKLTHRCQHHFVRFLFFNRNRETDHVGEAKHMEIWKYVRLKRRFTLKLATQYFSDLILFDVRICLSIQTDNRLLLWYET